MKISYYTNLPKSDNPWKRLNAYYSLLSVIEYHAESLTDLNNDDERDYAEYDKMFTVLTHIRKHLRRLTEIACLQD